MHHRLMFDLLAMLDSNRSAIFAFEQNLDCTSLDQLNLECSFHDWVWIWFIALSGIGTCTNSVCFVRTIKTLRIIQPSLLTLVVSDSVSSLACSVAFLGLSIFLKITNDTSELLCSLLFVAIHSPSIIGILTSAEVAIIRFYAVKKSAKNAPINDLQLTKIVIFTLVLLAFLIAFNTWAHLANHLPLAVVSETCLYGDFQVRKFLKVSKMIPILPLIIFLFITLGFDYLIVRSLRKSVSPEVAAMNSIIGLNDKRYEAIPIRATILSAATLLPYLAIGFTVSAHAVILKSTAGVIIGSIALILNALRFPLSITMTFALKKSNDEAIRIGTREGRQKAIEMATLRERKANESFK